MDDQTQKDGIDTSIGKIEIVPIIEEMQTSYLAYAMSVIISRALPDIRDGLKPVQRRVIYAMHQMGYHHNSRFQKCASVVGETMKNYHPHGDIPIYDALVRMGQDFSLRNMLIDPQGNFGSQDGDPPAASRYCLTGETLVVTNQGLKRIDNLSPNGSESISLKVLSHGRRVNKASKWFDSGKHPTIKLTTKRGYSLKGTANHPILVWTKNLITSKPQFQWKLLSEIKLGDIAVIDRTPDLLWPKKIVSLKPYFPPVPTRPLTRQIKVLPKTLNKDLAFILGSLIAEGYIGKIKIEFCNSDLVWINDFEKAWKKVFPDCRLHKFEKKPSSYGKKNYWTLEIHSRYIVEFLRNIGLEPVKATQKTIPPLIFQSPKEVCASFIQAYFEGDGTIGFSDNAVRIAAISISKNLIDQLQILLLRFGLSTSQYYDKYRYTYSLNLRGVKNYQIFQREIGFLSKRKKQRLDSIINKFCKDTSIIDYVPFLKDYIYQSLDRTLNYDRIRDFVFKHNFDRYTAMATNHTQVLTSILPNLKLSTQQLFEQLITNHYIFDLVDNIEDGDRETVYSIRVDSKCHSFVANGFINHNTECRLAAISDELLRDINKDTVDFVDNYSGTTQEPAVLPSVIPNLLLNGASGIAVGMATQIPPHNLGEVTDALIYMIDNAIIPKKTTRGEDGQISEIASAAPHNDGNLEDESNQFGISARDDVVKEGFHSDVNVEDLMKFIKGPDFPTGASIYDASEIQLAYATGKGRIVMRAKADIEETKSGRFDIIVTELPYQVNKAVLIAKIADLVKDKKIEGISDLRDESDRRGMRMVIELKRDGKPQSVLNNLYKHTAMQSVFNVNMVVLSDGVPHLYPLKKILEEFIHHRQVVIKRRSEFELREARARAHILEGLKIAVDNIDEVISIIRKSANADEARTKLMTKFKLTAIQATAILDMQLRRLAALERQRLEDELKVVMKQIDYLVDLLSHPEKILKVAKEELIQIKEKYAEDRRTRVYKSKVGEFSEEDLVADETTIVTITKGGYVKRQLPMSFRTQNRGGKGVSSITTKEEDAVSHIFYTKTLDNLLFFTDRGRVFQIKVWEIPEASRTAKGQALVNLINVEQGEKITAILTSRKEDNVKFLFMCTRQGNVKKTTLEEYANIRKNGLISIKLDAGDELCWVVPTKGTDNMIVVSRKGQSIRFNEKDVRPTHRDTSGVRGIALKGDSVVSMNLATDPKAELLVVMENGMGKKTRMEMWKVQGRGGSGIKAADVTDKTGEIVTAQIVDKEADTLVLTSNKGQLIKLNLKDVPTLQRQTQGVRLMRMKEDERVAAATVVSSKDKTADAEGSGEVAILTSSE